jgi:hypothetical protein
MRFLRAGPSGLVGVLRPSKRKLLDEDVCYLEVERGRFSIGETSQRSLVLLSSSKFSPVNASSRTSRCTT